MTTRICAAAGLLLAFQWCAASRPRGAQYRCEATAFSLSGRTELGTRAHSGIVAADPRIFPLGTRIRVSGAGPYSGSYIVTDTGSNVIGRHIDIYIPSRRGARRFGRRVVRVRVLRWGSAAAGGGRGAAGAH